MGRARLGLTFEAVAKAGKKRRSESEAARANERAAWIILQQPERYAGLPLLWAEDWVKKYGAPRPPDDAGKQMAIPLD